MIVNGPNEFNGLQIAQGAIGIILAVIGVYLIILAVAVINYILTSLSPQRMAKHRHISHGWLAWIPFGGDWIVGSIVDFHDAQKGIRRKWRVALLVMDLIFWVGFIVAYVVLFVSIFSLGMQINGMEYLNEMEIVGKVLGAILPIYLVLIVVMIVGMAWSFCRMICMYKIYEGTYPHKALKYMLLSLLVPLASAICLYKCKDMYDGMKIEPAAPSNPYPPQQ